MTTITAIPNDDRQRTAHELGRVLADTYTLMLKTQGFHWNVTGPQFNSLHEMFGLQYQELFLAADEVAERIRALGKPAPASYRAFAALRSIDETDEPMDATTMVETLAADHEALSRAAGKARTVAEDAGDDVSVDMMVARMTQHDKTAWMLKATAT